MLTQYQQIRIFDVKFDEMQCCIVIAERRETERIAIATYNTDRTKKEVMTLTGDGGITSTIQLVSNGRKCNMKSNVSY